MASGKPRRGNPEPQPDQQDPLGYLNQLAARTRGNRRDQINDLITILQRGMRRGRSKSDLFRVIQQAQQDGVINQADRVEALIQLDHNYGPRRSAAPRNEPARDQDSEEQERVARRRRGVYGIGLNTPLNRDAAPDEEDDDGANPDAANDDADDTPADGEPANPPAPDRARARDTQPAARPDGRARPRRVDEELPEDPDAISTPDAAPTAPADDALRAELEALRQEIRDLRAQRDGATEPAIVDGAPAPAARAAGIALPVDEAMIAGAPAQPVQRPQAPGPEAPAVPNAPEGFQNRLDQLQQNLNEIPGQPARPEGAAVLRDAPVEPLPDIPEAPVVRDEWPNWPEVQQTPPHPEYLNFLQQLLCQLQAQGINLQPDARLQNAINRMLHARDAHLAGLRGWDTAHGNYAAAGLQGHDRIASGNTFLMRQNYWGAFEQAMDAFKVELFRFILFYKRRQFGPQDGRQLRDWARQEGRQIAINCIFPVALTMYEDMERRAAMSLQETRDRNIFQRIGDWWNRQPRWGRILMGAGIAAGIGGLIGAFVGPGLALSYAAFRGGRALAGGALAFGVQSAVDSWFVSPHYQRQRQQASEAGRTTALGNIERLASGWESQGSDWYSRYGNLSELMRNLDRDALLHLQELNRIGQREGRTRLISGVLTGLAGGFAGGALYDQWAHPASAVALVPGGPKTSMPTETGHGDITRTIRPGDNLWKVSRGLIADGTITKEQWSDAWQHSNAKVLSHGVEKTVPFNTVGLVHKDDIFVTHHTSDGHVRFDIIDNPKDVYHTGDNAEFARALQAQGKPLPLWLKNAMHISDTAQGAKGTGASLAHAAAGVDVSHGAHTGVGAGPDNIVNFPRIAGAEQIVLDNSAPLLKSFPNESLVDQDKILGQLNRQITDLRTELRDPNLPPAFQTHDQELLNKALSLQHDLQGIHNVSLEHFQIAFSTELVDNRNIPWKFYEGVKDIRVGDYLWMAEQMHAGHGAQGDKIAILGALTDNKDASYSLEKFIREFSPGRFEKKMTLDAFFRHVPPTDSMYNMYNVA